MARRRPLVKSGSSGHTDWADIDQLFENPNDAHRFNWLSLNGKLDMSGYLSPHSDIAALMVFEHQMHMMNLLTRIGWDVRVGAYERQPSKLESEVVMALDDAAKEIVDYLLFIDEAPIGTRIHGSTRFAETFAARGPKDRKGRSLRDLDLDECGRFFQALKKERNTGAST